MYREALKRQEEVQRLEQEARAPEGVIREPGNYVTEYDVRRWGSRHLPGARLAPNERYVVNGALEALIVDSDARTSLTIRCELTLDAVNEILWKPNELSSGFDALALAFDVASLQKHGLATLRCGAD